MDGWYSTVRYVGYGTVRLLCLNDTIRYDTMDLPSPPASIPYGLSFFFFFFFFFFLKISSPRMNECDDVYEDARMRVWWGNSAWWEGIGRLGEFVSRERHIYVYSPFRSGCGCSIQTHAMTNEMNE